MSQESFANVSIVVPTMNSEKALRKCLDSLMQLDYPKNKLEVIIVDGGSKDSTLQVAGRYPIKILLESGRTRGAAYNIGLHEATGDFIAYIDSDAYASPNWLKETVPLLLQKNNAAVHCKVKAPPDATRFQKYVDTILSKTQRKANGVVYDKKSLMRVGGFNESMTYLQENELASRLKRSGFNVIFTEHVTVWHYPRSTLNSYIRQNYDVGVGARQLYYYTGSYRVYLDACLRVIIFLVPLLLMATFLFARIEIFNAFSLLMFILGITYSMYVYRSTDRSYRNLKYIFPAIVLVWFSTVGFTAGFLKSVTINMSSLEKLR